MVHLYLRWDSTFTIGIPTVKVESHLKYGSSILFKVGHPYLRWDSTFTVGIPTVKVESYLKNNGQV